MSGNERANVILQDRDVQLFRALASMRVIDREQAMLTAGFGSVTRANARLIALVRAGLLRRFFIGAAAGNRKSLYSLSTKSAALIEAPIRGPRRPSDSVLVADFFVQHQLVINEIHCAMEYGTLPVGVSFERWQDFYAPLTPNLRLIPDGYAELHTPDGIVASFLEVDLGSETMTIWKEKVQNYLRLAVSGECDRLTRQNRFRVLVVASTERRSQSIRKVVSLSTEKIFWFATLDTIRTKGLFGPVWLRPKGDEPQPLVRCL